MPQQPLVFSTYPHSVPLLAGRHRLVNMYPEWAEGPARSEFVLKGVPGMKEFSDPASDTSVSTSGLEPRGFIAFNDTEYTIIGPYLFSYDSSGTATLVASGIAGSGPVSMVADNNELIIVTRTGTDDYIFDGTNLSQFTGANIVDWRDVTFLDGHAIYVQASPSVPGRFSWSDSNALSTVSASSFSNAESEPDALLRGQVIARILWLFGKNTLEPWFSTGDSTVFSRDADGIQPFGLASHNSVAILNDRGFFLSESRTSRPHVRIIAGGRSQRISTNALDQIISSGTYSDAIGFAYSQEGHDFYCLVLPTLGRTFVYDASLGIDPPVWHERQSGVADVGSWDARQCVVTHDKVIVGHKDDGKLYELDFDTHTDAGNTRMALFTAEMQSSGEYWNRLDEILLDITVGEAASGVTVEPQIVMRLSRDGGQTFGDERWRGLGLSGNYDRQVKWHGNGRFRTCLAEFKITDAVPREVVKVHGSGKPGRRV